MAKQSAASFKSSPRWTIREARAALTALSSLGATLAEFARREGLDPQRLSNWRKKLGAANSVLEPSFLEIPGGPIERIEIVLPSGVIVRVGGTVDAGALRRIVDAFSDMGRC